MRPPAGFKGDKQSLRSAGARPQSALAAACLLGDHSNPHSYNGERRSLLRLSDECRVQKQRSQAGVLGSPGSDQIPDSQVQIQRDFNIKLQGTILSLLTVNQDFLWMSCYWVNEWKWHVSRGPLTLGWLVTYSFRSCFPWSTVREIHPQLWILSTFQMVISSVTLTDNGPWLTSLLFGNQTIIQSGYHVCSSGRGLQWQLLFVLIQDIPVWQKHTVFQPRKSVLAAFQIYFFW